MGEQPLRRIEIGPIEDIPTDRCLSVDEGRVVVTRVGSELAAFESRCLHQDSPLGGGMVKRGVLTCPLHFWRYDALSGKKLGEPQRGLVTHSVIVVDGTVFVDVPPVPEPMSMREMLLQHARSEEQGDR